MIHLVGGVSLLYAIHVALYQSYSRDQLFLEMLVTMD